MATVADKSKVLQAEVVESEAIVPVQVHLGSLATKGPKQLVEQATEMADQLAFVINKQGLFTLIRNRKYVMVEGWTTLGAMLGVVPVEESCVPMIDDRDKPGFLAKVKLIRAADGGQVGGASAECTRSESSWENRDSYALRSMAITRATGKAFRLSFSWIMKLAGFEGTPAEEMVQAGNSERDEGVRAAQEVAEKKLANYHQKESAQVSGQTVEFYRTTTEGGECILVFTASPALAVMLERGLNLLSSYSERLKCRIMPDVPEALEAIKKLAKELNVMPFEKPDPAKPMLPTIRKAVMMKGKKADYLAVTWGTDTQTGTYSCFERSLWKPIEDGVGNPADFLIEEHGKYKNITGIKSINGKTFSRMEDGAVTADIDLIDEGQMLPY